MCVVVDVVWAVVVFYGVVDCVAGDVRRCCFCVCCVCVVDDSVADFVVDVVVVVVDVAYFALVG